MRAPGQDESAPYTAVTLPIDLQRWTSVYTARNGAKICIRPLQATDRDREVAFIESLSPQTRYFRMMAPLRFLPPHLLDQLMTLDYHHSMAFAATVGEGSGEQFVGLGRYGSTDACDAVELGITVTDRWQRQGIAKALLEHVIEYATARGFRRMIGWVLYENQPMLALARTCGFKARLAPEHGGLEIERALRSASAVDH